MYLYNSLSRKKEKFVPNHPDIVKMYTCGPTVYHYAHIGNLRTYIMEDVLEKALRYEGYGPAGIAVYCEALTDNRQRTAPVERQILL